MRSLPLLPLVLLLLAAAPACVSPVDEEARECPCAAGWSCCNATTCVREGSFCPALPPPPDTTPPEAPRLDGTLPGSPTRALAVEVHGTSEAGARVRLYAQEACAGEPAAEAHADGNGSFRASLALAPEATTRVSARALDAAGNASPCSAGALAVLHDGTPPAAPTFEHFTPLSPSRTSTAPVLTGHAEPGAQVALYADAACTQALDGLRATADAEGVFRVWTRVAANAATTFHAVARDVAGNASACSAASPVFVHDDVAPVAAVLTASEPASPSPLRQVRWTGTAEPQARVRLFADAACIQVASPELEADAAGAWEVTFDATANALNGRWSLSVDAAGNAGACAELGAYLHDDVPPERGSIGGYTSPRSPGNVADIELTLYSDPGNTVLVYDAEGCPAARELAQGTLPADRYSTTVRVRVSAPSTSFYARARDAAGNLSPCSPYVETTYVYDTEPPAAPTHLTFTHPSPLRQAPTELQLYGRTPRATRVEVFSAADCPASARVAATELLDLYSSEPGTRSFQLVLPEVQAAPWRAYWAQAVDEATNASACVPAGALAQAAAGELAWGLPETPPLPPDRMRFDGQGRLYVVGTRQVDTSAYAFELRRRLPGGTWELLRTLAQPSPGYNAADFAVDAAGNVVVAWSDGQGSHVARYDAAAGTWDDTWPVVGGRSNGAANVTYGPQGRAHACWRTTATGTPDETYCASAAAGEPWGAPTLALSGPASYYGVRLLPGEGGRLRVLWTANTPEPNDSRWELYARGWAPDEGWGEPVRLALLEDSHDEAVGPDGTAWVVTAEPEVEGAEPSVWVRRAAPTARDFGARERLAPAGYLQVPRVGAGPGGEATVAWRERPSAGYGRPYGLRVRHFAPDAGWSATEAVPMDGPGNPVLHDVTPDGTGAAWLVWREDASYYRYLGPDLSSSAVVGRRWTRTGGAGAPQVLVTDPRVNYTNWDFSFSDGWSLFTSDGAGRVAVAANYDEGFHGLPPLHVLRVRE